MRRKQAAPDYRMADEMGVSSYIPKNVKSDARAECVWSEWIGTDEGRDVCGSVATWEVATTDDTGETTREPMCEKHAKEAQVTYNGTITVRRMKLV